ncbi:restriction endonuclease subunit S, partial [Candidatus Methanoperedens nitratireducens]|uniref:restriction endonuclease subunit S n=1 Tax=Candidatus Methanoperedens nitratireducens TaxID=1392998 RepID=UPI001178CAF4
VRETYDGTTPIGTGSTYTAISVDDIKNVKYPFPTIEEQHAIARFLDDRTQKIDSLIEKKQKLIELLKEERAAVINEAVTKGLDPGAPMRDSGVEWLGEIPGHWEIKRLKYVAEINRYTLNENIDSNYEFQYIDIGNVTIEGLTHPPQLMEFKDAPSRARRIVKKGDTIVSTVRTYLKAIAYIEDKADNLIASTGFAVLASKGMLDTKYLYYLMINEKIIDTISSLSTGVSYPAINSSELANIIVWFPKEIKEQQEIVNFIESETAKTHQVVSKMEQEIALLQEYRTALISEVVTGKIDVRGE